jgi:hypothetical protein
VGDTNQGELNEKDVVPHRVPASGFRALVRHPGKFDVDCRRLQSWRQVRLLLLRRGCLQLLKLRRFLQQVTESPWATAGGNPPYCGLPGKWHCQLNYDGASQGPRTLSSVGERRLTPAIESPLPKKSMMA